MIFNHVTVNKFDELERNTDANGVRVYQTPKGNKYPSITTILSGGDKTGLIEWRKRVGEEEANRISRRATNRGTKLHSLCENYINNVNEIDPPTIFLKTLFDSIKPFLHKIQNVHVQEQALYSDHLRIAGTVDCIAEYEGRLSVIDFKTASRRKEKDWIHSYFMQCAAYAIMYEERTGIPIDKLVVIIAVEDDEPQVFVEKRNNWVKKLLEMRDLYELNNKRLTSA